MEIVLSIQWKKTFDIRFANCLFQSIHGRNNRDEHFFFASMDLPILSELNLIDADTDRETRVNVQLRKWPTRLVIEDIDLSAMKRRLDRICLQSRLMSFLEANVVDPNQLVIVNKSRVFVLSLSVGFQHEAISSISLRRKRQRSLSSSIRCHHLSAYSFEQEMDNRSNEKELLGRLLSENTTLRSIITMSKRSWEMSTWWVRHSRF